MPSNNTVNMKSNRKTLLILLFVFVLPAIISFVMFFTEWRPSSTINHGELVLPVREIKDRDMLSMDEKPVKFSDLNGKWTMVYFDSSECTDACMSQLYFMRQTHSSLGKNYDRMQRIYILTDTKALAELKPKLSEYAGMLVWKNDKNSIQKLLQDFGLNSQSTDTRKNIYLLDQQGNLMMRYAPDAEPAGVRKDLERLLKYSNEK